MDRLARLIEETTDVRELKRALSVKLGEEGMSTEAIGVVLQVTPRAVRKWRKRYEREGVDGLQVRYRGSESYLSIEQRQEIEEWLGSQETITVDEVRDEIEARYGIVYQYQTILLRLTRRQRAELSPHGEGQSPPRRGPSAGAARGD